MNKYPSQRKYPKHVIEQLDGEKKNSPYPKPIQFMPNNIEKYIGDYNNITSRSSWETKFMRWCDGHPAILKWSSEGVVIPYYSSCEDKMRNYYMDFFVYYKTNNNTNKKLLIEIKPFSQTIPPKKRGRKKLETFLNEQKTYQVNQDKWKSANKYAKANGYEFVIMTEYELYPEYARKGRPIPKTK